jgi:two-component system response regulator YesN
MYKVLIVDDEPIIREGMKKIINWNIYGYKVIGDAENGLDAYNKILTLNPDLCIIDIKMPEMDGLELISKIKECEINTKIIILTGYPEFEYAQKAIDLGVESYILKPVDPNILIEKIKKVYTQLEKEKSFIEVSKEKILEKIIKKDIENLNELELNRIYNFNFPWKSYQIVLIYIENSKILPIKDIKNFFPFYSFIVDNFICILLKDITCPYIKRKLLDLRNHLRLKYNINAIISVGEKVNKIEDLNHSYNTALMLIEKRFIYNHKGILYPFNTKKLKIKEIKEDNIFLEIINCIENFNLNKLQDILEEKMESHIFREDSEEDIKLSYLNLYINVINYLSSNYPKFKDISLKYLNEKILNEFYKKCSLIDLHNFINGIFLEIIRVFSEMIGNSIISKITEYISVNYYRDLKLKNIAREFGYESCYFGKMFRKYTGEKFNVYLDKIRINKAKELLIKGMKVVEVAEKVGYKDIDYFIYKFKKYVGKSPQNFKTEIL